MDYPKIKQEINDMTSDNVKLLAQLFPAAVKDGQVDFGALKEELGQFEEVGKEKYELTWTGKQNAKKLAQQDVYNRTLKYIEADSKNPETTENLYIEGDNLEVLKLLHQNYYGAIKMIYIDPPYNTGNDFVYNDNFAMDSKKSDIAEGTRDEEGDALQRNLKSTNRYHANWLNMMYPRLEVAKYLLMDDGVIFISIDDNEVENLKKVCNEVLGEENFLASYIKQSKVGGGSDTKHIVKEHEYCVVYSKNILNAEEMFINHNEDYLKRYKEEDNNGRFFWDTFARPGLKNPIHYDIIAPNGTVMNYGWIHGKERFEQELKEGIVRIIEKNDGNWSVQFKQYLNDDGKKPRSMTMDFGGNIEGKNDFKILFNNDKFFPYPKSAKFIRTLFSTIKDPNSIVLDFFSGSATTAHAVMQLNAEDGGNRKFIMAQIAEKTDESSEAYKAGYPNICEIGKERIRRAGEKIKQEVEAANAQLKLGEEPKQVPDIGFKVFRTADTNIKWNLYDRYDDLSAKYGLETPDEIDFTTNAKDIDVVYEVMLRQKDVPLSATLETLTDIGSRTYLYGSAYLVCLETEITEALIDKLAALDPLPIKFIFRDSAFKDDINLKDETFRRLKNLIERNSGVAKKIYTVEFI